MDGMWLDSIWRSLDPVAIWVGAFPIRWYALAYVIGIFGGAFAAWRTSERWNLGIHPDAFAMLPTLAAMGAVIGGRLGYVLVYGAGYYIQHPLEIFATWNGGMSFHGGMVGVIIAVLLGCRFLGLSFPTIIDLAASWTPLGLMLGRLANFVNGELWGKPADPTTIPWAVAFDSGGGVWRHPTQIYEALLEGVVLLVIMRVLARRLPPRPQWTFSGTFLLCYGVFRFLVEFVRMPDSQIGYLAWGWLTMGQVLSLPMIAGGIGLLVLAWKRKSPQRGGADGSTPVTGIDGRMGFGNASAILQQELAKRAGVTVEEMMGVTPVDENTEGTEGDDLGSGQGT